MRELRAGERLENYRVVRELSRGGMALVYEAVDLSEQTRVAIKVIRPDFLDRAIQGGADAGEFLDSVLRKFKREGALGHRVSHPNVLPIYPCVCVPDSGVPRGELPFIPMKLIDRDRPSVQDMLEDAEPLSLKRASAIIQQACAGLDAAHKQGVLHLDVKSNNILLDADDHVFLSDFGLARPLDVDPGDMTQLGFGTPGFSSPEQLQRLRVDCRSDLYSLGCVLFHMLAGERPYAGKRGADLIEATLKDPPPTLDGMSDSRRTAFEAVIARAMAKDAEERFVSGADLAIAFYAAIHGEDATLTEVTVATGAAAPRPQEASVESRREPATPVLDQQQTDALDAMEVAMSSDDAARLKSAERLAANGKTHEAEAIYRELVVSESEPWPRAAVNLANLLGDRGDPEEAMTLYRRVVESGDHYEGPRAMIELGWRLEKQSDFADAISWYRQAAASGHQKWGPWGAVNAGWLLERQRDFRAAEDMYREAVDAGSGIDAGSGRQSLRAAINLAILLQRRGEVDEAESLLQGAIESGNEDLAPRAMIELGRLLEAKGDVADATEQYRRAAASGHDEWAPWAATCLGWRLEQGGDLNGAEVAYTQAVAAGSGKQWARAAVNLAMLLANRGEHEQAEALYRRAIESGHEFHAPRAMVELGRLLRRQKHVDAAVELYEAAIATGHKKWAPWAGTRLGELWTAEGEPQKAEAAFRIGCRAGHHDLGAGTAVELGALLYKREALDEAEGLFRQAANSGHPDKGPQAQAWLGHLLEKRGELEHAITWYRHCVDSGHPTWAPWAAAPLGRLLEQGAHFDEAARCFRKARKSPDGSIAEGARRRLGPLLLKLSNASLSARDYRKARQFLREAIDLQPGPWVAKASERLAALSVLN